MSYLFLSHSSENNTQALALAQWLDDNGWSELFLDISETRGLEPGSRWPAELKNAAHRCEAVIFVLLRAWNDSKWCLSEFLLAKQLGKQIFGVLVEDIPISQLPNELTVEYQLCDLVKGDKRVVFDVVREPFVPLTRIDLPEVGLTALKRGLRSAGLEATSFAWPPEHEPDRAPYRGLKPYEAKDAAIFFGRDAGIVRGLDQIRQLRNNGIDKLLVILGASGAGKSSFMRAGLWPRLERDDHHFFPLPVVRPSGAAMSGEEGLINCLATAFAKVGVSNISQGEIRNRFKADHEGEALHGYLLQLRDALVANSVRDTPEPTLVLPIDQGEELYASDGAEESAQLRSQLAGLGKRNVNAPPHRNGLSLLAMVTIRTDLYVQLQNDILLRDIGRQMIDLTAMDRAEYKRIIEGPAQRATEAGNSLVMTPALSEQLLVDTHGADALPMLAFTLERLYTDYGADGELTLEEYQLLGGVTGSLTAAIDAAMKSPQSAPVIPVDKIAQLSLLRQAFIPWLAEVDEQSGERRRRVASWNELPVETHPMLERLTQMRLLVRDVRSDADSKKNRDVVEVAHEALLRRWPALVGWLDADENSLKNINTVLRATRFWENNQRHDDFIDHRGERLLEAEKLLNREDFKKRLGAAGCDYMEQCHAYEDERKEQQRKQLETERKQIEKERELTRRLRNERNDGLRTLSLMHAGLSQQQTRVGHVTLGILLALEALPKSLDNPERPYVHEAGAALYAALNALHERKILKGHKCIVTSAEFSSDGTKVVTASADTTARVWDVQTGALVVDLSGHKEVVKSASFSPDGTQVVTASFDKTARVWDVQSGTLLADLSGHKSPVNSAAFSPDGTQVVTASADNTARVWDVHSGTLLVDFSGHEAPVNSAAFSPDGTQVVTASADNTARVWDVQSGTLVADLSGHTDRVNSAAFSPDGMQVVSVSRDATARIWDVRSGTLLADLSGHKKSVYSAAFSPDGTQVVTASRDTTARVWDVLAGTQVTGLIGHKKSVYSAVFSPDGTQVVTASADTTARVWDVQAGTVVTDLTGHEGIVTSAAFSHDGTQVVTAADDYSVRVWDVQAGTVVANLTGHEDWVISAAFSHDGTQVVTASDDFTARVWDVRTGMLVADLTGHQEVVKCASFSPNDTQVVTASSDKTARVWDVQSGTLVADLAGHKKSVYTAVYSADGMQVVSASADQTAQVWDGQTGALVADLTGHKGPVNSAAFSLDGMQVVTASTDNTARVWDVQTGMLVADLIGHKNSVHCAAFSPDGTQVVTASTDKTARVWDVQSGTVVADLTGHQDVVKCASFSPNGTQVVTASFDKTARVWDVQSGTVVADLTGHEGPVNSASFSPNGTQLVTASDDTTARVWDVPTGTLVADLTGHKDWVNCAAFSPDGTRVVTASSDKTARVWNVQISQSLIDLAIARVPRKELTEEQEKQFFFLTHE